MSTIKRAGVIVAIVLLSTGVATAVTARIVGDQQPAATADAPVLAPKALLGGELNEDSFVPTNPCRVLDTRKGFGKLPVGAVKTIAVRGSNPTITAQGGKAGGCAIPDEATAVVATVTAVDAGSGFLRAWPHEAGQPNATFMNYDDSFNVSNTGVLALCGGTEGASCPAFQDLDLRAFGTPTHLVIDVSGYYIRQMGATIGSDGGLIAGNRVTSVARLGTGTYEVVFDRNVASCTYHAQISNSWNPGYADVDPRSGKPNGVFVATRNPAGSTADRAFYLQVVC